MFCDKMISLWLFMYLFIYLINFFPGIFMRKFYFSFGDTFLLFSASFGEVILIKSPRNFNFL